MTVSPLAGKTVLVTRPVPQSYEFAQALRAAGAHVISAPTVEITQPDDVCAAERAVRDASAYDWIVFTSANGVDRFFAVLDKRDQDARPFGTAKIAAIGSATAQALRRRGISADVLPDAYIAEELARALIAATRPTEKILLFRAAQARDVLPDMLAAQGRSIDVVAAYKTLPVADPQLPAKASASDVITFTSSSTVEGFARNFSSGGAAAAACERAVVACIGPVTAQTARALGIRVDVVAHEYTTAGLLAALEQTLQTV